MYQNRVIFVTPITRFDMKIFWKIFRAILAVIGGVTLLYVALIFCQLRIDKEPVHIHFYPSYKVQASAYLDSLKVSGPYCADTSKIHMTSVKDSVHAKEIMEYFHLDTLYDVGATTWEKALAIAQFVSTNIPHANQNVQPEERNAIYLWEYTKNTEPAFNCRLHSIMMYDLLQSAGIEARFITCMPQDKNDQDCHVVNHVWLPELQKWAMLDSDMGGNWASDDKGTPLSLPEMRARYISGEPIYYHPKYRKATDKMNDHYAYMAKNTYWFSCWETLHFDQEPSAGKEVGRNIHLVPQGFEPFGIDDGEIVTSDAHQFWAAPTL